MPKKDEQIEISGPVDENYKSILTAGAVGFLSKLAKNFEGRRQELLSNRRERQKQLNHGELPCFLPETRALRTEQWTVAPIPDDLIDRRVEITGPVDRKMIINGLNSGAKVFMADFEDSNSPTWRNNLEGQINLRDTVNKTIAYQSPEGKKYELAQKTATLMVRPRGWHLNEKHFLIGGKAISGALFDFGLFFYHNAKSLLARGTAPYFYLPKMQGYLEARLWNDVFVFAENEISIPQGTIRATVLIETIFAAFEMDEILYELRRYIAGLNCGRWDYIFSFIKAFHARSDFVLPNRSQVTMEQPFLSAYVDLLIDTCHRRNAHAMGGMAAQIPIKNDPIANADAFERVRQDKIREVRAGHDGTWVAHPGLVQVAVDAFNSCMQGPNQVHRRLGNLQIAPKDLLAIPRGQITEDGLQRNIDVSLRYLASWLQGNGCVPLYNLMEDAATAEISRAQIWQWARHGAKLEDGRTVSESLVLQIFERERNSIRAEVGGAQFDSGKFATAAKILESLITDHEFPEFLMAVAYDYLD
ncbi:MAG: malate synthase A [Candidatus Acidiferrales bacterium]